MGKMQHFLKNKNLECLKCLILYENPDLVISVAKIIIHLLTISSFIFRFRNLSWLHEETQTLCQALHLLGIPMGTVARAQAQ